MTVWDPREDEDSVLRFERNVQAVARLAPGFSKMIESLSEPASRLVQTDAGLNIDIGHTLFYDSGVEDFVESQYAEFVKKPERINLGWPDGEFAVPRLVTRFAMHNIKTAVERANISQLPASEQRDTSGFAVILGVGIGSHIGRLINNFDVKSIVVVDQFLEFFWYSMHLHPWDEWLDTIAARNGSVTFVLSENPISATSQVVGALRADYGGTFDGTIVYTHYTSNLVKEIRKSLKEQVSYLASNRGFFEDENIMIMNSTRNFVASNGRIWTSRPRREKQVPAFVVAAGPSVDRSLDVIRKYKDQAVIISCGSGLKVLLAAGIKPDFHCEVENTFGQAEILELVASQHDVSGITLVAAATVHPRTAAVFDNCVFFHRDSVCSTKFFNIEHPIMHAVPTVSNCGLRFALGMAFREVYLFGVDLGKRIDAPHHSKLSNYFSDEEFMLSFQGTAESLIFDTTADANLGGVVETNSSFLLSRLFLERAIKQFSSRKVFNCSDGIEVPYCIPKLPETISLSTSAEDRDSAIEWMNAEMLAYEKAELTPVARYEDLSKSVTTWFAEFFARIDLLKQEPLSPFEIYQSLQDKFGPLDDLSRGPSIALINQSVHGTVFSIFGIYFRIHRRIEERHDFTLQAIFLEEVEAVLRDLEVILSSVVDELIEEINAASQGRDA